jgi:hypothetical protein
MGECDICMMVELVSAGLQRQAAFRRVKCINRHEPRAKCRRYIMSNLAQSRM